jgi:hypothetical protein
MLLKHRATSKPRQMYHLKVKANREDKQHQGRGKEEAYY